MTSRYNIPIGGVLQSPIIAVDTMSFGSVSVIANAALDDEIIYLKSTLMYMCE